MTIKDYIQINGVNELIKRLTIKGYQKIKYPHWIISDVRFKNEVEAIEQRNGIIFKINRTANLNIDNTHVSETELNGYKFKYEINNNYDIPTLVDNIRNLLKSENII